MVHEIIADSVSLGESERNLSFASQNSYGAINHAFEKDIEKIPQQPIHQSHVITIPVPSPIATSSLPQEPEDAMSRALNKIRRVPCAGILLAMLSGIFFATAGFIVKLVPDVNPIQIVISRSIVQLVAYMPVILMYRMPIHGVSGERAGLFFRGFFGFIAFTLGYVSYRMIPLADASTIIFSAPVYVSIFACIFLKEECGVFQVATIAVTIGGVLMISKPPFIFGSDHEAVVEVALRMEGTILALISSFCTALTFVMMRRLQKTPAAVVINAFSVVSIIAGIIALAIVRNFFFEAAGDLATGVGVPATGDEIGWLIGNGLCGVFGQLCLTVALKIEEASLVSLARTIDIVMAFVFQIIWLPEEAVHWTSLLGAMIVCLGVCVSAVRRWLKDKHGKFDTLWYIINCGMARPEMESSEKIAVSHDMQESGCVNEANISIVLDQNQSERRTKQ